MKDEFMFEELRGAASAMFAYIKRRNWKVVAIKARKVAQLADKMEQRNEDTA